MRTLTVALSCFLVAVAAAAQSTGPLPPLTAHVDVNVVNVDVTVTDRAGHPIMDLTKQDFQVFEDGKLMPMGNFSVIEKAAIRESAGVSNAAGEPTSPAVPSDTLRRKIVLLVDNNYIEMVERNAAIRIMQKQLQTVYGGGYEFAVAAIGHSLEIVQRFTSDRSKVHAALQRITRMPTLMGHQDADRSILSDRTRKNLDFETDGYDYAETVRFQGREQTFRAVAALQNTARAVVEMARAHTSDEGKKYMILLTGGMQNNTSFTAYDKSSDRQMQELQLEKAKVIDAIIQEANAANFTIHVVNARARGMQAPQHDVENRSSGINVSSPNFFQRGGGSDPIDVSDVDSLPLSIALSTGGMYMPSNDISHSLSVIGAQTSNFYSLGYTPDHSGDRRYHRIAVKVKRSGVIVSNRIGYVDLSPDDRLEQKLRSRTTFEEPTGSLPVVVDLGAPRFVDSKIVVAVTAGLPMSNITTIPRDGAQVGRVHVYLSIFDHNGRNVGFHHQLQEVTMPGGQSVKPFRYTMNVRLQKGEYTVVMTLRDELSNEVGSALHEVRL